MLKTLKSTFNKLLKNKYTFYIVVVLLALVLYAVLRYLNVYEAMTQKKEPMENEEKEEEETAASVQADPVPVAPKGGAGSVVSSSE